MQKKMLILCILLFSLLSSCNRAEEKLPRGVKKIQTKHRLIKTDKIEVLEFFWLGCNHCRYFHKNWVDLKRQFANRIEFRSIPATFENWIFDARVYLTMEQLGIANDGLLANYYEARQGEDSAKYVSDINAVAQWFQQRYGIEEQGFVNMFDSSLVEDKLKEMKELLVNYPMVTGVPTILISVPSQNSSYLVQYTERLAVQKTISDIVEKMLDK